MNARIENPALSVPGALEALQQMAASATTAGIPETTLYLAQLRASQINGCSGCVDIHSRELVYAGESSERINTVAIATINAFNRLNVATRQITGEWVDRIAQAAAHAA